MPSASFTLILCFFTFICGQLFNAFCMSLHPIKIESIASVVPVDTGFSFKTVIVIFFSALVVHDAAILLVIRHLLKDSKRTLHVLKTLPAAAADHIQGPLLLILRYAGGTGGGAGWRAAEEPVVEGGVGVAGERVGVGAWPARAELPEWAGGGDFEGCG
jgi:hypothetical protein